MLSTEDQVACRNKKIRVASIMDELNRLAGATCAQRQPRILLVEDESLLRNLIARFLSGEGFEIVEAGDGREGIERFLLGSPFDLVLLDLNLPILPGVEVCRRIKLHRHEQPVIICSAAILDDHVAALATLGVDQYLSKPYHPAELLTRISIELHRSTQATPAPGERLSASSWRLDRSSTRAQPAQALFKSPVID